MMDNRKWQRATESIYGGAAVAYLLATVLVFLTLRLLPPWLWLLLLLVAYGGITLVARQLLRERRGLVEKLFGVEQETAAEVVESVLRQKGVPFRQARQQGSVYFEVGTELAIFVQGKRAGEGLSASRIQIYPVTAETRLLAESLQQKLDEGFAPRGAQGRRASKV